MFGHSSRYAALGILVHRREDGTEVNYAQRRFLPQAESLQPMGVVAISEGDRLDLVAHRALGDPLRYWRLADANNAMNPFELSDSLGRILLVPAP